MWWYHLECTDSEDSENYLGDIQLNYLAQDDREELKKEFFPSKS